MSTTADQILFRYNPWWEGPFKIKGVFDRPQLTEALIKGISSKHILFLTGLRRVGKTTLMKLCIQHCIDKSLCKPNHIFYISLDDYSLSNKNIAEIVDEFRIVQKLPVDQKVFLFFDEITQKKDFELQLKNLYDSQNVKIFASSSSATLLKSKKPFLTGRNLVFEIMPLDFMEYLNFKGIKILKRDAHLLGKYFEDFLKTGGMPEYVLQGNDDQLRELVDDIIFKDIAALHNIKDRGVLKDLFLLFMERAGKAVSINKIAHIMSISPDSARRYLSMFADTYLIHLVRRWGKTNSKILSPQKIYAADLGIRVLFTGFRDIGSLFENYVYLKIRGKNPCYVRENEIELDFVTADHDLLEVKYGSEMTDKQKKLFEEFKARRKVVIDSPAALDAFLAESL
ncbi:MAG: ATP-binding protein [Chitinivibrionales bacterium]|nr:ATP-binding protein [Chitinivibrionales bacterium]